MAVLTAHSAFDTSNIPGIDTFHYETTSQTSTNWTVADTNVTHTFTGTGFTYSEEDGLVDLETGTITGWTVSQSGSPLITVTGGNYMMTGPGSPDAVTGRDIWDEGYLNEDGYPVYYEEADLAWMLRGADTVNGSAEGDHLAGYEGNDAIFGNAGDDVLRGWYGNDTLDGGEGLDIAGYLSFRDEVFLTKTSTGFQSAAVGSGIDENDTLVDIERLVFHNKQAIALDLDGNAGRVARLLGAVFGEAAVGNETMVGIGLDFADSGMSYEALAALAMQARGTFAHGDVVDVLWNNVIGFPIDPATKAFYVGLLDTGMTVGQLTTLAADTNENAANIHLSLLVNTGLAYQVQGELPF